MGIRQIKDSEPKYPNLAHCFDKINQVILKSENLLVNQKLTKKLKPRIQQRNRFHKTKKDFFHFQLSLHGNFLPFNRESHLGNNKNGQNILC